MPPGTGQLVPDISALSDEEQGEPSSSSRAVAATSPEHAAKKRRLQAQGASRHTVVAASPEHAPKKRRLQAQGASSRAVVATSPQHARENWRPVDVAAVSDEEACGIPQPVGERQKPRKRHRVAPSYDTIRKQVSRILSSGCRCVKRRKDKNNCFLPFRSSGMLDQLIATQLSLRRPNFPFKG